MKIDVYKTTKASKQSKITDLFVRSGTDPKTIVPAENLDSIGLGNFKKTLDIKPGDDRIALDVEEALAAIEKQGFYLASAEIIFDSKPKM